MGKVLKVQDDGIIVQLDSNGKMYKLKKDQFDFKPVEGDAISLSKRNNQVYATKKELDLDLLFSDDLANDLALDNSKSKQSNSNHSSYSSSESSSTYSSNSDLHSSKNRSSSYGNTNKVIYILLALFLGLFGAHRFYAKKGDAPIYLTISIIYGLFYLLVYLIPPLIFLYIFITLIYVGLGIKVLIDVIVAATRSADAYGNIDI